MSFPNDTGVKLTADLAYATRRPAAGPQLTTNMRPTRPAGRLDGNGRYNAMKPVKPSGAGIGQEVIELADDSPRPAENPESIRAGLRRSKRTKASLGWLARDPSEWIGRKILNRKTGKVYVVKTVYMNGRVELEKSWMTYSFYIWTIRTDFEPYA